MIKYQKHGSLHHVLLVCSVFSVSAKSDMQIHTPYMNYQLTLNLCGGGGGAYCIRIRKRSTLLTIHTAETKETEHKKKREWRAISIVSLTVDMPTLT